MADRTVAMICEEIIAEAQAVISYTAKTDEANLYNPELAAMFNEKRIDEVEHLQELVLALTECFFEKRENTDEEENEDSDGGKKAGKEEDG